MVSRNPMFKKHTSTQFAGIEMGEAVFKHRGSFGYGEDVPTTRKHSLNNVLSMLGKAERLKDNYVKDELHLAIDAFAAQRPQATAKVSAPEHNS